MAEAVHEGMQIVSDHINAYDRVAPFMYSTMSRGGKTTLLKSLHDELNVGNTVPLSFLLTEMKNNHLMKKILINRNY
jgi:hypothetical protein